MGSMPLEWSPPPEYVPRIIIKLKPNHPALHTSGLLEGRLQQLGINLSALPEATGLGRAHRIYVEDDDSLERLAQAVRERFGAAPQYQSYIGIRCHSHSDPTQLVAALKSMAPGAIERVFVESGPAPPPDDPAVTFQGQVYLGAAGINAIGMWDWDAKDTPRGDIGAGVTLFDVEEGWDLPHPDLPAVPIDGRNRPNTHHGTLVLGVIGSRDVQSGCLGIAYGADLRAVSLWRWDAEGGHYFSRAEAIKAARLAAKPGDVILLETQVMSGPDYLPAEADELVFNEIRSAVACGISVVEAAGNSTNDIDGELPYGDSGALIATGASNDGKGWNAMANRGASVHCFAAGTQIMTIDPVKGSGMIDGTSGASAVIAGAAVLLQSWAHRVTGAPIGPMRLREMMSSSKTGTSPADKSPIGVMPDVVRVRDALALEGVFADV